MDIGSMDIAQASTQMAAQQVQQSVTMAVMEKAMDAQTEIADALLGDLASLGPAGHVDISV